MVATDAGAAGKRGAAAGGGARGHVRAGGRGARSATREMAAGGEIMAGGRGAPADARSSPPAARGVAAVPGVAAAPGPGPGADLATAAPSPGLAPGRGRGRRPSPGRRGGPSPSRRPCPARAPDPALDPAPGARRPCLRGSPSPGRDPRAPPSPLKRKERCPLRQTVMSMGSGAPTCRGPDSGVGFGVGPPVRADATATPDGASAALSELGFGMNQKRGLQEGCVHAEMIVAVS